MESTMLSGSTFTSVSIVTSDQQMVMKPKLPSRRMGEQVMHSCVVGVLVFYIRWLS